MAIKFQTLPNRLAGDPRVSQDVREQMAKDPQAGLKAAAQQFETMFLQMVLKSMRDTVPQDGLLSSDQSRFYTGMLDQQLAQTMAASGSVGFAKLIEQQLGRNLPGVAGAMDALSDSAAENLQGGAMEALLSARTLGSARSFEGRRSTEGAASPGPAAANSAAATTSAESASPVSARDFVNRVWPHAVEASRSTGIPPQFLVAHAALESGWGKTEIRRPDGSTSHNLFGIKAGRAWGGESVETPTTEYVNGQPVKMTEKFRSYGSYAEAFRDYANLLRGNPRYGGVIGSQDGTEFANRLQQAGYATDPAYADKLARIINGPTLRQALIG